MTRIISTTEKTDTQRHLSAIELWKIGHDTGDIARIQKRTEAEVYNELAKLRSQETETPFWMRKAFKRVPYSGKVAR
jgi:hypothetical protein